MPGLNLYGKLLFGQSTASKTVTGQNAALAGDGGVDADATGLIGGRNIDTGASVSGTNKGRRQGICCGVTAGRMVAFLGGNEDATDHGGFASFFTRLRFQGAYVKDHAPSKVDRPAVQGVWSR